MAHSGVGTKRCEPEARKPSSGVPAPPNDAKLRAVAVEPRVGGDGRDLVGPLDLAEPRQRLAQDLGLKLKLALVGDVLVVAAAAVAEDRAERLHAVVGRLLDLDWDGLDQPLGFADDLRGQLFARQDERGHHGPPFVAGQTGPAVDQLFDLDVDGAHCS